MKKQTFSGRAMAVAAAGVLLVSAVLETALNNPLGFGPFGLAWLVQTHPVSSWSALAAVFLLMAATGRLFFSVVAVGLLLATIALASWIKIDYLGTPLTLADVRFFVSNLAENLVLFTAYPGLGLMLAGAILLIIGASTLALRAEPRRGIRMRLVAFATLAALAGSA